MTTPLDVAAIRRRFPALERRVGGRPAVFFDGPAGTQVPRSVIEAITACLTHYNANHGGLFATSVESDAMLAAAHAATADLLGTPDPDCVVFGANMTTLTFALSRALAATWQPGDEVLVTRSDHDANVSPWVLAARDAGATVKHVAIRPPQCTLDLDDLAAKLSPRTRLVAVGYASNATGTNHPVRRITEMAHAAGALVFLDAVHYAPHGLIDVVEWDCDFLACSAYKFFGPHVGILYGKRALLEQLPAYKLRPAPDSLPGRWMTGTQSHEGIAGVAAAVEYLADLGRKDGHAKIERRAAIARAMQAIAAYERQLAEHLLDGLAPLERFKIWGITDRDHLDRRVPTFALTHHTRTPTELARLLAKHGIFTWHGNFYALPLTETLGLEPEGLLRIGLVHYNTHEEIERLLEVLREVG